jgi:ADP-ribosylglycohydrolase
MLGKPVECGDSWTTEVLEAFLRAHDAWPLRDWFPAVPPSPPFPPYREIWPETTAGRVDGSSRDDDVDYTILNLHVLRRHGLAFRTSDVAAAWLGLLPFLQTYTAERAAIRTLVQGRGTGAAATFRNPYREWIGAAIRGDVFGYVCPGDPAAAARLAYRDAALSHTGNGVYGEMWVAALVAAAFTAGTAREALDRSLAVVPPRSRLHAAVDQVRGHHDEGLSWREARDRIGVGLGHYSWVHTVNNAAVLAAGLLYGAGDFSATIGLTVSGGWDTDSTGATAGSVAGILAGPDGIPARWRDPLNDRVRSAVFGYDGATITGLARWTVEVARRVALTR